MLTSAPWLVAANPIQSALAGAGLGLRRSEQIDANNRAGNQIQLAYSELGQRAADAAANREQAAANTAAELQRAKAQDALSAVFRNRSLTTEEARTGIEAQREERQAKADAAKKLVHVGTGLYSLGPNGQLQTELAPLKALDPLQKAHLDNLRSMHKAYTSALLNGGTRPADIPGIQSQINSIEKQMRAIDGITEPTDFGAGAEASGPGVLSNIGSGIGSALRSVGNFFTGDPGPSPQFDLGTPGQGIDLTAPIPLLPNYNSSPGIKVLEIRKQ